MTGTTGSGAETSGPADGAPGREPPGPGGAVAAAALDARIAAARRTQVTSAALTALIGFAAAYLMLTWDTRGSIGEALTYPGHLDLDFAIAVLAFFVLHALGQWKADGREVARLRHERATA